ncbi:MAG: hypothetical protein WD847_19190 [Pirellulales bacterium]
MSTTDTTGLAARTNPGESLPARIPPWAIFAAGFIGGIIVVYWGVTRPLSSDLARLDRQVAGLSRGISQLAGQTGQAAKSTELLAVLARQGQEAEAASEALARIQALQDQLVGEQPVMADALDQLDEIQCRITRQYNGILAARETIDSMIHLSQHAQAQASDVQDARQSLESLVELKDRALSQSGQLEAAGEVVAEWSLLAERLAARAGQTEEARRASDDLLALEEGILCGSDVPSRQKASEALDELVTMRSRLQDQSSDVGSAQARLDGLLSLKDQVIGQTGDLVEAIEALETSADVQRQFVAASQSFDAMRRWMAEIVLLEPTFQRLIDSLKPLGELANLRRLSPAELRHAARAIADQRAMRTAQPTVPPGAALSAPSTGGSAQIGKAAGSSFLLDSVDLE